MNLLEHYIEEIYGVEQIEMPGGWGFVLVDMMVNCYGNQQRVQTSFTTMEQWEKAKEQGYYMA
ncbi:MAG: hypothetical protein ACYDG6_11360 [Thermincolia bacterium]